MCRWVAEAIFHDFLALVNVAGEGDEKTSRPRQIGLDGAITFNFNSVDIRNAPEDPGMAESIALACLVRGQATAEDLKALSDALPDEIRVREADKPQEDQKSFTTGVYIHGDQVGVRRNVRMFPLSTRLLAEIMRSNFAGQVFSSLAFFREVHQPPRKDTTNGPHDNLLLACSSFENGGLWTEAG